MFLFLETQTQPDSLRERGFVRCVLHLFRLKPAFQSSIFTVGLEAWTPAYEQVIANARREEPKCLCSAGFVVVVFVVFVFLLFVVFVIMLLVVYVIYVVCCFCCLLFVLFVICYFCCLLFVVCCLSFLSFVAFVVCCFCCCRGGGGGGGDGGGGGSINAIYNSSNLNILSVLFVLYTFSSVYYTYICHSIIYQSFIWRLVNLW